MQFYYSELRIKGSDDSLGSNVIGRRLECRGSVIRRVVLIFQCRICPGLIPCPLPQGKGSGSMKLKNHMTSAPIA
jgi:hypothetical protein